MLIRSIAVFAAVLLFLYTFTSAGVAYARPDVIVPAIELNPTQPISGELVDVSVVLTNRSTSDISGVPLSLALDGSWVLDDVLIDVPARTSLKATMTILMPVMPGQHEMKICADREKFGDSGEHCHTLNFTAIDASTIVAVILSPKEETVLSGEAIIRVGALGLPVEKVELYWTTDLIGAKHESPYDFVVDTTKYENGVYWVYAVAYYETGLSRPSAFKKFFVDNSDSVVLSVMPEIMQRAELKVGQDVIIESSIQNEQPFRIAATLIVLVQDSNGYTQFLSWKEERISSGQTIPISQTWTPRISGAYDVKVFIWDTIENAVPLGDVMYAEISVRD